MSSSTISWLDFSESERRKAVEVVAFFEDRETRDELRLGYFFPNLRGSHHYHTSSNHHTLSRIDHVPDRS